MNFILLSSTVTVILSERIYILFCSIKQGKIEARKFCSPENLDKFLRDTVKIEEDDQEEDY